MWRNLKFLCICHAKKVQMSPHVKCREIWHLSTLIMCVMWRMSSNHTQYMLFCCNLCCFCQIFFFYQICRNLRCFVAKSVLLRFTRFHVEKIWTKKLCLWRKKDKYHIWVLICVLICIGLDPIHPSVEILLCFRCTIACDSSLEYQPIIPIFDNSLTAS